MNKRIEILKHLGHSTEWYEKSAPKETPDYFDKRADCCRLTMFRLENDYAWTVTSDGEKYQRYRELKKPVIKSRYYCSACKEYFDTWKSIMGHDETNTTKANQAA